MLRTLLMSLLIVMIAAPVFAETYYVSEGDTINSVVNAAAEGDTVIILDINEPWEDNVSWSTDLVIRGEQGALPQVRPSDPTLPVFHCIGLGETSLLENLELIGEGDSGASFSSAMHLANASLTTLDVSVSGFRESAGNGGGAVYSSGARLCQSVACW